MNNDKDVIENDSLDNLERVKTLSPGMMVVKRFFRNKLAIVGLVILVFMLLLSVVGPLFSPYGETQVFLKIFPVFHEVSSIPHLFNQQIHSTHAPAKNQSLWAKVPLHPTNPAD